MKQKGKKRKTSHETNTKQTSSQKSSRTQRSKNLDQRKPESKSIKVISTSCRICLKDGDIHIFENKDLGDIADSIFTATGVKVSKDDGFPEFLCNFCNEQLQNAISFRQIAQKTNTFLQETPKSPKKEDSDFEFEDDNEVMTDTEIFSQKDCIFKNTVEDHETKFHCVKCSMHFEDSKTYADHIFTIEHRNVSDSCPFCLRAFKCIVRHLALHKKYKTSLCDICGQKFLHPTFLHHRKCHFEKLPFKCTECPYQGRFRGDFKVHMRTHTGERPYKCTECPRQFISKSNLNRHTLTHRSEYTFQCDMCDRGFFTQRDLDIHSISHSNVRQHQCALCEKAFSYRKGLMRHTLKVHKREKLRSGKTPNYVRLQPLKEENKDYSISKEGSNEVRK